MSNGNTSDTKPESTLEAKDNDTFGRFVYKEKKQKDLDETGYSALQLEKDEYYWKIKIIKSHLENPEHPLKKFLKLFDNEFWECFESYL